MSDTIQITGTIRDFTRQLYAETVSTVETLFAENAKDAPLKITGVRVCCGSEAVNKNDEGDYLLPDNTPWLAELAFGSDAALSAGDEGMIAFRAVPSRCIASWSCTALQGVGRRWAGALASSGIRSIEQLASLSHDELLRLLAALNTRRVFEFHRKARLAMQPCPAVPLSSFDKLTPLAFLSLEKQIALKIAPALTVEDWGRLVEFLSTLVAVINDSFLEKTTLRELFCRPIS